MIHRLVIAAAAVGTLLLTGCATVINGQTQSVSVIARNPDTSEEVSGAQCSLNNGKGSWQLTTPGSATVNRAYGDLVVECRREGQPNGTTSAKSTTGGAVFGNVLAGGAIGAGVDIASGAAYSYPNVITVVMGRTTRLEPSVPTAKAAPSGKEIPATPPQPPAQSTLAALRVPYLSDARQAGYQSFLTHPSPRAFAISDKGNYGAAWGTKPSDPNLPADPKDRALALCKRSAGKDCMLYVVNDEIVYRSPAAAPEAPAAAPLAPAEEVAQTQPPQPQPVK